MSNPTSADARLKLAIGIAAAASLLGSSSLIVAAQQYTATGSVPTSSIPPQTSPDAIPLVAGLAVVPVNNSMFGNSANVYEVQDHTPIPTTYDLEAFSGADATDDEAAVAADFGPIAAGTVIQPLFVRGSRVYVYLPDTGSYAWLGVAPSVDSAAR